jgi:hypothetical protein
MKPKKSDLKAYLAALKKRKRKKPQVKKDLEEFVDGDGNFMVSNKPILDPSISPVKTTDQSVAMGRITNDPITRGYRTYYGEGIEETDMSKAFGYEETKEMDGKETYDYLIKKLGLSKEEANDRTLEFGKDPTGEKDKKSSMKNKKGFITKARLNERERILKMVEDVIAKRKADRDIVKNQEVSKLLKRNISALVAMAENEGVTKEDLINMIKNE